MSMSYLRKLKIKSDGPTLVEMDGHL